ncbi:Pr6Pr family membrane protein [Cryobacterium sp. 1639]|uniref:Pr6Pr family membrane protein n=1 Tax=Cryobacterium inferilacus TaxID=2866629 RepID=UPI001C73580E|nr:Pr6Pr family membrane protein [Cryobacterium sp. 1639]MBX0299718.1 Pr6Pr family membrane protein [Cryobacterium sp. 1639]
MNSRAATVPGHERPGTVRQVVGVLRILLAVLVLAAIVTQITDQLLNDAFDPAGYFGYFTIQSSLMNVVVLSVGGVLALRLAAEPELLARVRMSTLSYAVITGVVYNLLLRGLPADGSFVGISWPNEVLHVWAPALIVLDWLLAPGRPALAWKRIWFALVYPLAWLAYALLRGTFTDWWTYPFLNPGEPGGWPSVLIYIVIIAVTIIAISAAAIGLSRIGRRDSVAVAVDPA